MSRRATPRFAAQLAGIIAGLCLLSAPARSADAAPAPGESPILRDLQAFRTVATVLHVGAHPDDENTQLISAFSRGRGYRTAYLSITRGDGGQNESGPEFGEKLGVARTQELLAARRLDGGRQFFTRAIDFGFTKSPEETLRLWDHAAVLGDVVRVIRQFRPDVIITRFPIPPGSGGHGQHTASAILAVEAFKLAGDPQAYPEQLAQGLTPWQPKRIRLERSGGDIKRAQRPCDPVRHRWGRSRDGRAVRHDGQSQPLDAQDPRLRPVLCRTHRQRGTRPESAELHALRRRCSREGYHGRRGHHVGPPARRRGPHSAHRRCPRQVQRRRSRRQRPRPCWLSAPSSPKSRPIPSWTESAAPSTASLQGLPRPDGRNLRVARGGRSRRGIEAGPPPRSDPGGPHRPCAGAPCAIRT